MFITELEIVITCKKKGNIYKDRFIKKSESLREREGEIDRERERDSDRERKRE